MIITRKNMNRERTNEVKLKLNLKITNITENNRKA